METDDNTFSWTPEKRRLLTQLITAMLLSLAAIVISTVWLVCIEMPYSKSQTLDIYVMLFFIGFDVLACAKLALETSMLRQFCKCHRHMERPQPGLEDFSGLMVLALQERPRLNMVLLGVLVLALCDVLSALTCSLCTFLYLLLAGGI